MSHARSSVMLYETSSSSTSPATGIDSDPAGPSLHGMPPLLPGDRPDNDDAPPSGAEAGIISVVLPLILPIYLPSFLFGLGDGVAIAQVPLYARSIGCNDARVGACSAAAPTGKFLADIPAGMISSRLGSKNTLVVGLSLYAVFSLAASLSENFFILVFCLVLAGCAQALFTVTRTTFVKSTVSGDHRGRVISLLGGVNRLTRAIGPLIGGYVAHHIGLSAALSARGIMAAIAAVSLYLGRSKTLQASEAPSLHSKRWPSVLAPIKQHWRKFATAGLVAFILSFIRRSRNMLLPLEGADAGFGHRTIGAAIAAGYAIDSSLFAPVGYIADKYGRKMAGVPAILLLSFGLVLLSMVANDNAIDSNVDIEDIRPRSSVVSLFFTSSLVMGLGNGLSSGLNMLMGTDLAPSKTVSVGDGSATAAEFLGVWSLICDAGAMIGPYIVGAVAHHTVLSSAVIMVATIGFLGAAWFAFGVSETHRPNRNKGTKGATAPPSRRV